MNQYLLDNQIKFSNVEHIEADHFDFCLLLLFEFARSIFANPGFAFALDASNRSKNHSK